MNISSITNVEASHMAAHQRHLQRLHQRRKRTNKPTSKLILNNNIDASTQILDENIE